MVHQVLILRFSLVFTHNLYKNQWLYHCGELEQVNKTIIFLGLICGFVSTFFHVIYVKLPEILPRHFFLAIRWKLISLSNVCI